jgi:predicted ATPase/DNA-binding SARP family transcriptional activator
VRLNLLGNIEVIGREDCPLAIGGTKQKTLLAVLGSSYQMQVSSGRLIDALWESQPPQDPLNTLQHYVGRLRSLLDPGRTGVVESIGGGYVLHVETDVSLVETAAGDGRRCLADGRPEAALGFFDHALSFWRGEPFADLSPVGFVQPEVVRLDELHVSILEDRFEAALACGQHHSLVPELNAAAARYPLRERICGLLMIALYRSGRQADALRAYQQARATTVERLGLEPSSELGRIEERILLQDPALTELAVHRSGSSLRGPGTSFVGRSALVTQLTNHLRNYRLVTLTGPAGIGKTRLAIETLRNPQLHFGSGIWTVDLEEASKETLLERIASVLPVSRGGTGDLEEAIFAYLEHRDALILFDGCERLSNVIAIFVTRLLERCPGTTFLVTSQSRLGCAHEVVVNVPPLDLTTPAGESTGLCESVELFVQRGRDAFPAIDASEDTLDSAARICAAVDGVPLAIELAAARLRSLNPQQIEAGLVDRFALLTRQARHLPARHRSLRAALDWSFGLLDDDSRRLMCQLGVFAGTFDLDAVAAVLTRPISSPMELVQTLIDFSLVQRESELRGNARYRLLDSVREYARESMTAAESTRLRVSHAHHYAVMAENADRGLRSGDNQTWLSTVEENSDNFRAALESTVSGAADGDVGLRLAARLGRYWDWTGALTEGRHWLRLAVELDSSHPDRALAHLWLSYFEAEAGDLPKAREHAEAAVTNASPEHLSPALGALSLVERQEGDTAGAYALAVRSNQQADSQRQPWFSAWSESLAAMAALELGNLECARDHSARAQIAFLRIADRRGEGWCLALQALAAGDSATAAEKAGDALMLAHSAGDEHTMEWMLRLLAATSFRGGAFESAVELLSSAESLAERRGGSSAPAVLGDQALLMRRLQHNLEDDVFDSAWLRGERLALSEALRLPGP